MSSDSPRASEVKEFFDQWGIYRKVVEKNYLHHREAYAAIRESLQRLPGAFSFVDLGAGDASATAPVLESCPLKSYEAVDISAVALDLARQNVQGLPCDKAFTQIDFFEYVQQRIAPCDVLFIGLSLHHLQEAGKQTFFRQAKRILPEQGRLIFYEPIREAAESRDEILERWWKDTQTWEGFAPEELAQIKAHVFGYDYPEPLETFHEMATQAGFRETQVRYVDPDRFYAVVECVA